MGATQTALSFFIEGFNGGNDQASESSIMLKSCLYKHRLILTAQDNLDVLLFSNHCCNFLADCCR